MVCAVLAIQATLRGEFVTACWWVLYSTLTDKLDGMVARLLKASSALGVQLDSLADLLNYGFVPAAITYGFFQKHHDSLGWTGEWAMTWIGIICGLYAIAAAFRLARFNISKGNNDFFFGIPTTFAGGIVASALVCLVKYGAAAWQPAQETFPGWRLLGSYDATGWGYYFPFLLIFCAYMMVSTWRIPKAGKLKHRALNIYCTTSMIFGWVIGIPRLLPEFMPLGALQYFLIAFYAHFYLTPKEKPEPIF